MLAWIMQLQGHAFRTMHTAHIQPLALCQVAPPAGTAAWASASLAAHARRPRGSQHHCPVYGIANGIGSALPLRRACPMHPCPPVHSAPPLKRLHIYLPICLHLQVDHVSLFTNRRELYALKPLRERGDGAHDDAGDVEWHYAGVTP